MKSLPFASKSIADRPTYAVVGSSEEHGRGVLSWHTCRFEAETNAGAIDASGGFAAVVDAEEASQRAVDIIFGGENRN